ncbi:MAG TPA: phosphotransferase, partial [Dehalococcoidia bacterium]
RIAAVLDWEMATLGDPMTDVGLQVMYWARGAAGSLASTPANAVSALPGFLTLDEALQRYGEKSGRSMERLDFDIVLAYFKLAVIVEGIYARFLEGGTVGAGFEGTGEQARGLAVSGLAVADRSPMTKLRG